MVAHPQSTSVWTFYSNILVLFYVLGPLGLGTLFAVLWARVLGIPFGPDVPYEAEHRHTLALQLSRLGFRLDESEPAAPSRPTVRVREPQGRRMLRMGLGAMWVVFSLLSLKPNVATGVFLHRSVWPLAVTLPPALRAAVLPALSAWQQHAVAVDIVAVYAAFFLGALLFAGLRGTPWVSAVGAAGLWALAEGFGGLFGRGSFLGIAPGTFGLTLVASLLLLLPFRFWQDGAVPRAVIVSTGILWILGAFLQVVKFWHSSDFIGFVPWNPLPQPSFAVWPLRSLLHLAHTGGAAPLQVASVAAMTTFGALLLWKRDTLWTWAAAGTWLLLVWWATQDFGGALTGDGTTLGTAVVWALLLGASWLQQQENATRGGYVSAADKGGIQNGRAC